MPKGIPKTKGLETLSLQAPRSAVVRDAPRLHDGEARRVGENLVKLVRNHDYRVSSRVQRDDQREDAPIAG